MIRNILFDLGVVLVHLDYEKALRLVLPLCPPERHPKLKQFLALDGRDPIILDYERGRVTTEDFFRHFASVTGYRGTYPQFIAAWHDTLSPNAPMVAFARSLAATHAVYLATNTGEVQLEKLHEYLPPPVFYRNIAASCRLGSVKPERAFYEKALALFKLAADACLFVDDRPENVAGAEACGLRSILYTSPAETVPAIRRALSPGP